MWHKLWAWVTCAWTWGEEKRLYSGRIKVGRWNERVRAKRCDAVDWDSASVRACDVVCTLDTAAVTEFMAAWFVFLHFFLVPLCWYAVSERQMLPFFAGGLVGVDKHLFQRFLLILSWLYHWIIFSFCYSPMSMLFQNKTTKYCLKHEGKSHPCHPWQKYSRSCFITRWRVYYKCVQLVQGEIMLISITIILLFNFEKNISCLSVSSKLQNEFPISFYCLPCFVLERKTEKKPYN